MVADFNTQFKTQLNELKSQIEALQGNGSASGISTSGNSLANVNCLWDIANNANTIVEGSDEQKANAITKIATNIIGMLSGLGRGEAAKANKEATDNTKKVNELDNKAQNSFMNTQMSVDELINQISQNAETITSAIEKIKELGGDKGQIAEAQAQLEEQVKIVEENQKILNNKNAKPEEKEAALKAITGASEQINTLVETVLAIQEEIQTQNANVENASNNVTSFVSNVSDVITKGTEEIQGFINAGQGLVTKQATTTAQGVTNEVTGKTATAAGEVMSKSVFTAAKGVQLMMTGSDQSQAGQTRIQNAATNLASLGKSIGEMGSDLGAIANFTNSVGNIAGSVCDLIGEYDATLTPVITATGSWTAVAEANAQLEEAIKAYSENETQAPQEGNENKDAQQAGDKEFNFDVNLFRAAFEEK